MKVDVFITTNIKCIDIYTCQSTKQTKYNLQIERQFIRMENYAVDIIKKIIYNSR